jgi:hypothetical protein
VGVAEEKVLREANASADPDIKSPSAQVVQHADVFDES